MQSNGVYEPNPTSQTDKKKKKYRRNKAKKSLQWIQFDPELAENAHAHAHEHDQSFSNADE